MRTGGIILCGGRSKRMGTPKALLPFGSETMLERVTRILGDVVESLVVVAATHQKLPELQKGTLVVRDRTENQGPLEALCVGLSALQDRAVDAAFVSGCDTPLLQCEFVRHLFNQLQDYQVVVPADGPHLHPLAAVYRPALAPLIDHLLANGKRRPADLFTCVPTRIIDTNRLRSVDPDLHSLMNVNDRDQYQRTLEIARLT